MTTAERAISTTVVDTVVVQCGREVAGDRSGAAWGQRASLHPGFVRTHVTGQRGDIEPAEAAARLLARID
jgi:hypothetical protein